MQEYKEVFKVEPQDLDDLNHVNNIRYVEWIQEISKKHWFKATTESIRSENIWVVKNHNITYAKSALLGDTIEVFTYIKDTNGPLSIRVVEIKNNKTGQLLVKASTEWCLLDAKTFRPKRVPESIQNLFNKT
ncbi:acyl-CoA thioesterase [Flagellimonas hymeniacidonis]|uniref:Acyl-CoA thioesterase n=1 Tax=Flagellimonas hymeniacidonis TaxID=2603628 RepID=A0A5C8V306_9FLAO|nr:acyl-ACP thioesterase domain-containing protein [Flagellimonas hymeniacidonis]TXN35482.1 acyl-CoA thioesterase [Flagellimonas hymeniacidonis]